MHPSPKPLTPPLAASSIERLEARIAPASLTRATEFSHALPVGGLDADSNVAAQPPELTAVASAPDIFTTEHTGVTVATLVSEFETPGFKGILESLAVRRTATSNPGNLPIGGLDFYYQITLTSGDPRAALHTVAFSPFDPFLIAAGVDGRTGTIASSDPLNGRAAGTQLPPLLSYNLGTAQFDFVSQTVNEAITIDNPQSAWMVFRTNARSHADSGVATLAGSIPGPEGDVPLGATAGFLAPIASEPPPRPLIVTGAASGSLVQVFDPATGALKESFNAFGSRNRYGVRVATGDVNGDGVEDIIAGSGRNSVGGAQVRVFDGANPAHPPLPGALGNFKPFGAGFVGAVNVAAGDVNGDGFDDIIVAPAAGSSGQVRIFSGVDGSQIAKFTALSRVNGGVRIAAGDLDGDGRDEVIVGAGVGSSVRVFDGLTGALRSGLSFKAFEASYTAGVNVAAGDVNGDGIDEILVSTAERLDRIAIFDHNLAKLAEIQAGAQRGVRLAAADLNGDGFSDVIAGQGNGGTNAVAVFDGITRSKRFDLSGFTIGGTAGVFVG